MATRTGLSAALLGLLTNDPEWTEYVAGLSPSTPLRAAVEDYLQRVRERVALTDDEVALADHILDMMAERGYQTSDAMAEAIESGVINLRSMLATLRPNEPQLGAEG